MRYVPQVLAWLAAAITLAAAGAMNIYFLTSQGTNEITKAVYVAVAVASLLAKASMAAYLSHPRGSKVLLHVLVIGCVTFDGLCGVGFSSITRGAHMTKREALAAELKRHNDNVALALAERSAARAHPEPERATTPAASFTPRIKTLEARGSGCDRLRELRWTVCRQASELRAQREAALAAEAQHREWSEKIALADRAWQDARAERAKLDLTKAGAPTDPQTAFLARYLGNAGVPNAKRTAQLIVFGFQVLMVLLLELIPIVCIRQAMRPAPLPLPKPETPSKPAPATPGTKPAQNRGEAASKAVWGALATFPNAGAEPVTFKLGELADQIDRSKTAVRNALRAFSAQGVIALETGRFGCRVEILGEPA